MTFVPKSYEIAKRSVYHKKVRFCCLFFR